ncbi:MAG: CoA transferase [Alphaproteobacteria bacterium]|nr:CoA transferase [Alphaproteobacteria bacterium]
MRGRPAFCDAREHEAEIDQIIDWTRRRDKHEAMRLIGDAGVLAGAVLDTGDLLSEPSFAARGIIRRCGSRRASCACRHSGSASMVLLHRSDRPRCLASTPPRSLAMARNECDRRWGAAARGIV